MADKTQDKYLDRFGPKITKGQKVTSSRSADGLSGHGPGGGDAALAQWYEGAQLAHVGQGKGHKVTPAQRHEALMVHSAPSSPGSEESN